MLKYNIHTRKQKSFKPETYIGERIETKIKRIISNNEPITDGAEIIYQERKEGVSPDYDIRTDRFEVAIDAMDAVSKAKLAKRLEIQKQRAEALKPKQEQQIHGTEPGQNPA